MPLPAPFLADGRVLRAADRDAVVPARDAHVAADALTDVFFTTFGNFLGQKRIGDRGTCAADQIENAAADLAHHRVRRGEASDTDHRSGRDRFDEADHRLMAALGSESRGRAVGRTGVHLDVPQVRQVTDQLHRLVGLRGRMRALAAAQLLQADTQGDGALPADSLVRHLEQFAHQTHPVAHRAAIGVGALIPLRQEELVGQVAHARIDVDDVKVGSARASRRLLLRGEQVPDVPRIHDSGPQMADEVHVRRHPRGARGRHRGNAVEPVHHAAAAVPELDARQGPVAVNGIGHQCVGADVIIVPERRIGQRGVVRARIDGHVAGAYDAPAAFGFGGTEGGAHARHRIGHAARMRHGVEAVGCRHRADLDGLEQNVVAGIAGHVPAPSDRRCAALA